MLNDISKRLNELRLYGIAETLAVRLKSAYKSKSTYEELLLSILDDQYEYKDNKALTRRIKASKFEEYKSFECYETMGFSIFWTMKCSSAPILDPTVGVKKLMSPWSLIVFE